MKTYFKVVSTREADGVLGYEELYGNGPRYFLLRLVAEANAAAMNRDGFGSVELVGTYSVEERKMYDDGTADDSDDEFFRRQILGN